MADTPSGSAPSTLIAMVFGLICGSVWVARTCSTSLVPMPKAIAPNAPCVEVCESPQTIVMPGWVRPSCGPITCTMPCPASPIGCSRTPNSAAFLRSVSTCVRETGSVTGLSGPVDRHAWADDAGRRHVVVLGRDGQVRAPYLAAGRAQAVEGLRAGDLVHKVQVDEEQVRLAAALRTTWASQIFSASVRGALLMRSISLGC